MAKSKQLTSNLTMITGVLKKANIVIMGLKHCPIIVEL